jgi:hypothetical protein
MRFRTPVSAVNVLTKSLLDGGATTTNFAPFNVSANGPFGSFKLSKARDHEIGQRFPPSCDRQKE